jgi:hypothetical protein
MFRNLVSLSPVTRRILGAASLCLGVYVVAGQLRGSAPREVEVRLALAGYSRPVRAVDVSFSRGDVALRGLHRRFQGDAPATLHETVSLPEGRLRATVSVTLEGVVAEAESTVTVTAGEPLTLPTPASP